MTKFEEMLLDEAYLAGWNNFMASGKETDNIYHNEEIYLAWQQGWHDARKMRNQ